MPPSPNELALDPWVGRSRLVLWFCGAMYLLLGVVLGVLFPLGSLADSSSEAPPMVVAVVMGVLMFLVSAGWGLFNFVVAWGLGRGARWAWICGVIIGGIYAPSICLPLGAVLLYGLLNDATRKAYMG